MTRLAYSTRHATLRLTGHDIVQNASLPRPPCPAPPLPDQIQATMQHGWTCHRQYNFEKSKDNTLRHTWSRLLALLKLHFSFALIYCLSRNLIRQLVTVSYSESATHVGPAVRVPRRAALSSGAAAAGTAPRPCPCRSQASRSNCECTGVHFL